MRQETSKQAAMNRRVGKDLTTPIVDGVLVIRKKVDSGFLAHLAFQRRERQPSLINTGL
jgi:hypothetical protein